jgi:hypothetical protein
MDDRIHTAFDDDARRAELTPEETRDLERMLAATRIAADHLRSRHSPGVVDGVMRDLAAASAGRAARERRFALLLEPRSFTFRPIWALLAAAALAGVILVPALRSGLSEPSADSAPIGDAVTGGEGTTVFVQFRLDAPEALEVRLAGSFTGWEPRHALHRSEDGVWTVMVALEPGIHDYAFVVDGSDWRVDPSAPRVDDGFGGENSRLALLLGNGMRES